MPQAKPPPRRSQPAPLSLALLAELLLHQHLIVHSTDWTSEMKRRFPGDTAPAERLRWFGFGTPVENAALFSADDALTLIAQQEIRPFERRKKGKKTSYASRDMHLHALPWPREVLEDLGATEVELRVTLSYFIEPSPGEQGGTLSGE